jgi:hypothetical protein
MKKQLLTLTTIATLSFIGCGGGGGSSSPSGNDGGTTTTNITVERGPVYEATVKDASGKTATVTGISNIYTFSGDITYPITVTGGWIDLDGDGVKDINDTVLEKDMLAYDGTVITPFTTLLNSPDATKRDEMAVALAAKYGISKDEFYKLPSKANETVAILSTALYKYSVENNVSMSNANNYNDIKNDVGILSSIDTEYNNIKGFAQLNDAKTNGVFDPKKFENYIVQNNRNSFAKPNVGGSNSGGNTEPPFVSETITFKGLEYKTIKSSRTSKIWLDRNIGATEICSATNNYQESNCTGLLFNYGRGFDGHERADANGTAITSDPFTSLEYAGNVYYNAGSTNQNDWVMKGLDDNGSIRQAFYDKIDGNGVCPLGFRVPTVSEFESEQIYDETFNTFLKLPNGKKTWSNTFYNQNNNTNNMTVEVLHIAYNGLTANGGYNNSTYGTPNDGAYNRYNIRCIKAPKVLDANVMDFTHEFYNDIGINNIVNSSSNISIDENASSLTVVDVNVSNGFTFFKQTIVPGVGDYNDFEITGSELKLKTQPDYETKTNYEVYVVVTATDGNFDAYSETYRFRVSINDVVD